MRMRSNEKAQSVARKILSSDHYIRKQENQNNFVNGEEHAMFDQ